VQLKARPSVQTPIDECHIVALSDGGILYPDANGSLVYADRRWRAAGRPDQAAIPVVSDNVCDPAVLGVWDTDLALEDASVAEYVELINDDGLVAVASSGSPIARRWRLTHPEPDLWIYQSDGDALAAFLLSILERRAMRLGSFVIHLVPQRPIDRDAPVTPLSVAAAPLRRGDLVQFVHDFTAADGAAGRLDQFHRIDCVSHAITPDTWNVRYIASPVIAYATRGLWDVTAFTWDDPDPTNVWSW
jgi:hypothetical protein